MDAIARHARWPRPLGRRWGPAARARVVRTALPSCAPCRGSTRTGARSGRARRGGAGTSATARRCPASSPSPSTTAASRSSWRRSRRRAPAPARRPVPAAGGSCGSTARRRSCASASRSPTSSGTSSADTAATGRSSTRPRRWPTSTTPARCRPTRSPPSCWPRARGCARSSRAPRPSLEDVVRVALTFGVSTAVALFRLRTLGLASPPHADVLRGELAEGLDAHVRPAVAAEVAPVGDVLACHHARCRGCRRRCRAPRWRRPCAARSAPPPPRGRPTRPPPRSRRPWRTWPARR